MLGGFRRRVKAFPIVDHRGRSANPRSERWASLRFGAGKGASMRRAVAIWLGWWAFLFIVWMLLVLTQATAEVVAGVFVAAIGATAAEVVRRTGIVELRPWSLWPRRPWRLALTVISDCRLLTIALWRQLRWHEDNVGAFRGIPFEAGADDDPAAAARRAAYTAQISLTPNTYVIGIDREHNNMLVHELLAGPRATTRERVLGKL
jgi:multisubunit Na+/H+ antiporter MnhE subunit